MINISLNNLRCDLHNVRNLAVCLSDIFNFQTLKDNMEHKELFLPSEIHRRLGVVRRFYAVWYSHLTAKFAALGLVHCYKGVF